MKSAAIGQQTLLELGGKCPKHTVDSEALPDSWSVQCRAADAALL